jgi:type III pantothenate kinase
MYLTLDIGNTLVKVGVFDDDHLIEKYSFNSLDELKNVISFSSYERIIVSSVKQTYEDLFIYFKDVSHVTFLSLDTPLPFKNLYGSGGLGIDRIALAAGAQLLYPNKNCLIIDLGTCVTYDFITGSGEYLGGAISPGTQMRFKSLYNFTARLPLIELTTNRDLEVIGKNTKDSITSGVVFGILGEIRNYIDYTQERFGSVNIILSGGDAKYFESKIKAPIFVLPELLLVGLNAILRHNASN